MFFSKDCMSKTEKLNLNALFIYWVLNFPFGIFISKELYGLVPEILGYTYGSSSKSLKCTHFQWSKTKCGTSTLSVLQTFYFKIKVSYFCKVTDYLSFSLSSVSLLSPFCLSIVIAYYYYYLSFRFFWVCQKIKQVVKNQYLKLVFIYVFYYIYAFCCNPNGWNQ